ncbi:MAG: GFA family protein, partial [Nitrospira sp.]|nr:GFA family protein [Nitrospira sp.]
EGQCLCGAVRFRLAGAKRDVVICHCGQCRRWHGHVGAYTRVPISALTVEDERSLAWYRSSERARRGFCRECGSSLF